MNIEVTGARILYEIPIFGSIPITETVVVTWVIMVLLVGLSIFLTRDLKLRPTSKRQIVAELLVKTVYNLVDNIMGPQFSYYAPFIGSLFALMTLCNMTGLVGAYSPTSDINTNLAWALVAFALITYTKLKAGGLGGYIKGFFSPVPVFAPFNILGEVFTPFSMAFRLFGNVAAGGIITSLIYAALALLSGLLLSWLPGALSQIPIFQLGIPAVLSIYFDVFSGFLQTYIFCMLTMMNIKLGAEE